MKIQPKKKHKQKWGNPFSGKNESKKIPTIKLHDSNKCHLRSPSVWSKHFRQFHYSNCHQLESIKVFVCFLFVCLCDSFVSKTLITLLKHTHTLTHIPNGKGNPFSYNSPESHSHTIKPLSHTKHAKPNSILFLTQKF